MWVALRFVAALLACGGCCLTAVSGSTGNDGGGAASTGGLVANGCERASDTYVGVVGLSRIDHPLGAYVPGLESVAFGGFALYVPRADAGALPELPVCGSASKIGQCCYIAPPPDAGANSSDLFLLSDWFVKVSNEDEPDAGGYLAIYLTDGGFDVLETGTDVWGSLIYASWTGGEDLRFESNGATAAGAFSGQIKTPLDFEDLSPNVFWDGGVLPIGSDFAMTWSPGGASSVTIEVVDHATLGQIVCTVPDNGAFTIPESLLATFPSGDYGDLVVSRSIGSCAHSENASVYLQVQTQTSVGVQFQ